MEINLICSSRYGSAFIHLFNFQGVQTRVGILIIIATQWFSCRCAYLADQDRRHAKVERALLPAGYRPLRLHLNSFTSLTHAQTEAVVHDQLSLVRVYLTYEIILLNIDV